MSKNQIDINKFTYSDEFIENDLDILENVSIVRQEPEQPILEPKTEEQILESNNIDLNSDKDKPKD
jgi:hypothetical protein